MTMRIVLITMAAATFVIYWVWMRWRFFRPNHIHPRMRMLSIAAVASGVLHTYYLASVQLNEGFADFGLALYILALGLFVWSAITIRGKEFALAYSTSSPTSLVARGPYRWMRHPFYLAYSMTWVAGAIACRSLVLSGTVVVMLWFYIGAAKQEEGQFLTGRLREEYLAYRAEVGIFGPKILSCRFRRGETQR